MPQSFGADPNRTGDQLTSDSTGQESNKFNAKFTASLLGLVMEDSI